MSRIEYLADLINLILTSESIDALCSSDQTYSSITKIPNANRIFLSNEHITSYNSYLNQCECSFDVEIEAFTKAKLDELVNVLGQAQNLIKFRSFTYTNQSCSLIEGKTILNDGYDASQSTSQASPFVLSYDEYPTHFDGVYLRFDLPFSKNTVITDAKLTLTPTNTKTIDQGSTHTIFLKLLDADEAPALSEVISESLITTLDDIHKEIAEDGWVTSTSVEFDTLIKYVMGSQTTVYLKDYIQQLINRSGWEGKSIGIYIGSYISQHMEFAQTPTLVISANAILSNLYPLNIKLTENQYINKNLAYGKISAEWFN